MGASQHLSVTQVAKAKAAAEARRQAERAELERLAAERRAAGLASPSPERQASPTQPHATAATCGSRENPCCFTACSPDITLHAAGPARHSRACRRHTMRSQKQHLLPCACMPGLKVQHACSGRGLWVGLLAAHKRPTHIIISCELLLMHLRSWLRGSFLTWAGAGVVALVCM